MMFRKANTVLRAKIPADHVSVIPNAVDAAVFKPLQYGDTGPPHNRSIETLLIICSYLDDALVTSLHATIGISNSFQLL